MKRWVLAGALVAVIGALAGCSSGPRTVQIQIKEMAFSTDKIALKAGEPVRLVLVNKDKEVHDLSVDTIPVDVTAQTENPEGHTHSEEKEPDLHVSVAPGSKGWVEFTPTQSGTYTFYCTVAGHRDHGMEGTLFVS